MNVSATRSSRPAQRIQPGAPAAAPSPAAAPAPGPADVSPERVAAPAAETLRAELQAEGAQMQARVESAPGNAATPQMMQLLAAGMTAPDAKLRKGASGPAVSQLQGGLKALGYDVGPVDGKFGPVTERAVKAFQRDHGLQVDGYYGPQTRAALQSALSGAGAAPPPANTPPPATTTPPPAATPPAQASLPVPQSNLRKGSRGEDVKKLQHALNTLGFNSGPVDGSFGSMTERALKDFQRSRGIVVDGTYGPQSRGALTAALGGAGPGPVAGTPPPAPGNVQGMLDWARGMVGSRYAAVNPFRFGEVLWDGKPHRSVNGSGTTYNYPAGTRVFDCSGFVVTAYKQMGIDLMSRGLTSTSTMRANRDFLRPIPREQLQPGDLVFYRPKNGIGHVVIYMGNGQCVEAAGGSGVVIRGVDWSRAEDFRRAAT